MATAHAAPARPSFHLAGEPWIPVLVAGGRDASLVSISCSLRETLVRAHEIVRVWAEAPDLTIALHRFLLAFARDTLPPIRTSGDWRALWRQGAFLPGQVDDALARHRPHLDLFDPDRPFAQDPALDPARAGRVARLRWVGHSHRRLFDDVDVADDVVAPDYAARALLAAHAFDLPGLKTAERGVGVAPAAPLLGKALLLLQGRTLFETLLLNLPPVPEAREGRASWGDGDDAPPSSAGDRLTMQGALTHRARRIRLIPERAPTGEGWQVRDAVIMPAHPTLGERPRRPDDPMFLARVADGEDLAPREGGTEGEHPLHAVGTVPMKALDAEAPWEVLDLLVAPPPVEEGALAGRVLAHLMQVAAPQLLGDSPLRVELYGMRADRARPIASTVASLAIPGEALASPAARSTLARAICQARRIAAAFRADRGALSDAGAMTPVAGVAFLTLGPAADEGRVHALTARLRGDRWYWERLGESRHELLARAATDPPAFLLAWWGRCIREGAAVAMRRVEEAIAGGSGSTRTGRAALAAGAGRTALDALLRDVVPPAP